VENWRCWAGKSGAQGTVSRACPKTARDLTVSRKTEAANEKTARKTKKPKRCFDDRTRNDFETENSSFFRRSLMVGLTFGEGGNLKFLTGWCSKTGCAEVAGRQAGVDNAAPGVKGVAGEKSSPVEPPLTLFFLPCAPCGTPSFRLLNDIF